MMHPTPIEKSRILDRFSAGVAELEQALEAVPEQWIDLRPEPVEWSVREIIAHCADMELMSSARCRMLIAQPELPIIGIDPDTWAATPGYQQLGIEESMALIRTSRTFMAQLFNQLTDSMWAIVGHHTESGAFPLLNWLDYFASHLHAHADQIARNVEILEASHSSESA